MTEANLQPS